MKKIYNHSFIVLCLVALFATNFAGMFSTESHAQGLTITITHTDASCAGSNDGMAIVTVVGGTPPYAFSWDDPLGQQTDTAFNLAAGCYHVSVADQAHNSAIDSVCIGSLPSFIAATTATNVTCYGGNDGMATVTTTGVGNYTYSWAPSGGTANHVMGLTAGCYTVTVSLTGGCTETDSICITEPPLLTASVNGTSTTCIGCNNGTASVIVNGGVAPYAYMWSPGGGTGPSIAGLAAGDYTCCVTDANGCDTCSVVTLLEDPDGVATVSDNNASLNVFPNPVNDMAEFIFELTKAQHVVIGIYDATGKLVAEILNADETSGRHVVKFDATAFAKGVYVYHFRSDMGVKQGRLVIGK